MDANKAASCHLSQGDKALSTTAAADDTAFMRMALDLAKTALARGDFPVGCILAAQGRVLGSGSRRASGGTDANELDHAEMVALRDYYRHPHRKPSGLSAFCTMEPCLMCFAALVLAGVDRIVYAYEDVMGGAAGRDRRGLAPLYRDHPLTVVAGVLRPESLSLFKAFFADPANGYWRDSLLARYTLDQSP